MTGSSKRLTAVIFIAVILSASTSVALVLARERSPARTRLSQAPLGTALTYQGQLTSASEPVNDTCEMAFRLYDQGSDGGQIGPTINTGVAITDGLFTVQLDFGGSAFQGDARWLDIMVKCPGDTGFTHLGRQEVTAAPYALYALGAPWNGLTGVPAGFGDGVDNDTTYSAGTGLVLTDTTFSADADYLQRRVGGSCDPGSSIRVIGSDGNVTCEPHDGTYYDNVIVVAKGGAQFTSIQAALDSITDASTSNRYLVWVAPGTYTETVTMKEYVDIEGAGEMSTKITYVGSTSPFTGTVLGANHVELRFLTVENTGGADYATAIYNISASPRLFHVTATAFGADSDNLAVFNDNSSPMMNDVSATASGPEASTRNAGVLNAWNSSPIMTDVAAVASGGIGDKYGVYNGYSSSPAMRNVTASAFGESGDKVGVWNYEDSSPTMTNVIAKAWGGGGRNAGVVNDSSPATLRGCSLSASGGTDNYGLWNWGTGTYTVTISSSQITGSNATIHNADLAYTLVGASLMDGGPVEVEGGAVICAGVYDEDYIFYPSACP